MAEAKNWHIVSYDVSDEKCLRKTRKVLSALGQPVQYSVFRVRGTKREIERLRFELLQVMDTDDRLMIVRLCNACAEHVVVRGKKSSPFSNETPEAKIL